MVKDVIFNSINDEITTKCNKCSETMVNLCSCGSFELKYDNKKDICGWSNDGYNVSRYYDEIKKSA